VSQSTSTFAERATTGSVGQLFLDRVASSGPREAFRSPAPQGGWATMTWAAAGGRVRAMAAGLIALGVQPEDRVAIACSTRLEWMLADCAVMCAGAATTTVYPSTPDDDVAFILADSGSKVVVAEDMTQVAKVLAAQLPDLVKVVVVDGEGDGGVVITLAELEALGRGHLERHPGAIDDAVAAVGPDSLATLIYTSGTTGRPKGVRLLHDNWLYEGEAIDALDLLRPDDVQYLWLPLSHVFGKVLLTAQLRIGFATAVDGRVDRIVDGLAEVRPTFVAAVPRIFEKVHARVTQMAADESPVKQRIFDWAFGVGREVSKLQQYGREPSGVLAAKHKVADRLVLSKVRARFGGRLRYFVSGSAALSRDIAEWFHAAGILVLEGYGLTETSAFTTVNLPHHFHFGTVGVPAPGTEIRIADDGEIELRGRGVMAGYHGMPDATAEVLSDGWFSTGDIGHVESGLLHITDRKKDLIKTSNGKYVAPQSIEVLFKATCPLASQIVVHGDGRSFITALVTLDEDAVKSWAAAHGMAGRPYEEVVTSPEMHESVAADIERMNHQLARWETVKKFVILPRDLSVEAGEITPSLKVRRKAVVAAYAKELDALYA
jgi:long-chain acyl-CoA synthetase